MIKKCTTALFLILSFGVKAQYSGKLVVEELLQSEVNSMGQKIIYPEVKDAKVAMKKITFPPGETTGWHKHDIPVFSYIIKGTLTVETEDGKVMQHKENSCFSESYNIYHKGTNKENTDLVVMAIYLGGDEKEISVNKK
jgi:quercetin dioxygenase-like cupin family protein